MFLESFSKELSSRNDSITEETIIYMNGIERVFDDGNISEEKLIAYYDAISYELGIDSKTLKQAVIEYNTFTI